MDIFKILAAGKARKASDLHLSAGSPPLIRVNGELMQMTEFPIPTPEEVKSMFMQITTVEGMEKYQREHELDYKYILPDGTSLRCNAAQERGQLSLSIRILAPVIPTIDELQLPEICKKADTAGEGPDYYFGAYGQR